MIKRTVSVIFLSIVLTLATGPVSYYGRMIAEGNKLVGEHTGTPVQVRGMSFFWSCINWENGSATKFWTASTVDAMVAGWKSEILRAAMAADGDAGCGDYQGSKTQTLQMVKTVVDRAIERDIYVIVDWHSHKAHQQQTSAIDFFVNEMKEYHNKPHVIFEIYNEPPDGDANQWTTIKPYMQAVVNAIRNAGANNLILVGTPYYDQDPDLATSNPVNGDNLAYVLHFYAAQHTLDSRTIGSWRFNDATKTFRNVSLKALNDGYPLFVSEYGTVNADGNGSVSVSESDKWHAFMDEHKISSCNWSINNKPEGASAFVSGFNIPTTGNDAAWITTGNMTTSGKYTYDKLVAYAQTAEWRNPPPKSSSSSDNQSSSSSSENSPILVSKLVFGNSLSIMQNAVNIQATDNVALQIFDLKGNTVRTFKFAQGNYIVQMADLPRGLYIVKASSLSWSKTAKLAIN